MSESGTARRHGRRARRLTPQEEAAAESQAAAEITGEVDAVPRVRGAVAPPSADAPVPKLRKFGRRARIIELVEEPQPADRDRAAEDDAASKPAAAGAEGTDGSADGTDAPSAEVPEADTADDVTAQAPGPGSADRDRDGVELGELPVTDAPDPKPAPRFEGTVLHRAERTGGRPLLWAVWALIAVALIVLVALLLTGVIGTGTDGAAAALDDAARTLSPTIDRTAVEVPAA